MCNYLPWFSCFFLFLFLVSWDNTLVGGDACDGVKSAYLGVGRWQRWSLVESKRKEQHKNMKACESKK